MCIAIFDEVFMSSFCIDCKCFYVAETSAIHGEFGQGTEIMELQRVAVVRGQCPREVQTFHKTTWRSVLLDR